MGGFEFMDGEEYTITYAPELPFLGIRNCDYSRSFIGKVESFNPHGQCAFRNDSGLLVIHYATIISLRPTKKNIKRTVEVAPDGLKVDGERFPPLPCDLPMGDK